MNVENIGFIILRHVNSEKSNLYWQECYRCIRRFYPENKIVIIDDNSNYDFITALETHGTKVIQSEYKGRGELLSYYYYANNKWFDTAVFLHDSTFIQQFVDFYVEKYQMLWHFPHLWNTPEDEKLMLYSLSNSDELIELYDNDEQWNGCFGGMCVITHDYLTEINDRYTLMSLTECITNRGWRMRFERVIGVVLQSLYRNSTPSKFGYIHDYNHHRYAYSYDDYIKEKAENTCSLPIVKVFSGR